MEANRCERCGSSDVRNDEVWGEQLMGLGECLRCSLRWTRPLRRAPRRVSTASRDLSRGPETVAA